MYNYIIPLIIIIIIGIVFYYRYQTKEGFQELTEEDTPEGVEDVAETIDINTIPVATVNIGDTSNMTPMNAVIHANNIVAPLIASNADLQGVIAYDQISIVQPLAKPYPPLDPKYTTATDTRPVTDIERQCEVIKNQLKSMQDSIIQYKNSGSWTQVRYIGKSIEDVKTHMSNLGC